MAGGSAALGGGLRVSELVGGGVLVWVGCSGRISVSGVSGFSIG